MLHGTKICKNWVQNVAKSGYKVSCIRHDRLYEMIPSSVVTVGHKDPSEAEIKAI